jgi:hypothetical protein
MSKRSLFLISCAFALVGAFVASESSATVPGCFVPSEAADFYISEGPSTTASDVKLCEQQCKDILNGCRGVVTGAEKCTKASIESELKVEERACKEEDTKELEKSCKDSVKADRSEFKDELKSDVSSGEADCEAAYDACISDCND